jgi:predicted proteasome-type protease
MTFCVAIKSKTGVVALSDTRISSGLGVSTSKKIKTYQENGNSFFIMSSGLRSIRDKVINLFEDSLANVPCDKLFKVANLVGNAVKQARAEDLEQLQQSKFFFDGHFIVGGQCSNDKRSTIFLVFPEGNWVEASDESPYTIIGNTQVLENRFCAGFCTRTSPSIWPSKRHFFRSMPPLKMPAMLIFRLTLPYTEMVLSIFRNCEKRKKI